MTRQNITITTAMGYRQEYRPLRSGERGYRRRILRIADGVQMYAGPGTDPSYPSTSHPEWQALSREERLAIRAALDAADELTGVADYLSERAGREAVERGTAARGLAPDAWKGREADDARRDASQAEYEHVLAGTLEGARARLAAVLRRDQEARDQLEAQLTALQVAP